MHSELANCLQDLAKRNEESKNSGKDLVLKTPVQETHRSLLDSFLMSLKDGTFNAPISIEQNVDCENLKGKISQLKEELLEHKENTEKLHLLEKEMENIKAESSELRSSSEMMKKKIKFQQQRIEQLEFEPSVEIMQIASPEQTKTIENLNQDLIKANEKVMSLCEENECLKKKISSLNDVCLQLTKGSPPEEKANDQEPASIELAIQNLKDQIEHEKSIIAEMGKAKNELEESLKEQQKKHSEDLEELGHLKRTNEMMRKMESKDMDRLNQVTFERDNYKKECEEKILIIKDLHRQLQSSSQATDESLIEDVTQVELKDSSDILTRIERLARQLSAGEETIGILSEENTNLKTALKSKIQDCQCSDLEKKIAELLEENENLQAVKSEGEELLKKNYYEEKTRRENLEMQIEAIQENHMKSERDFKERQERDGKIIFHIKEELKNVEKELKAGHRQEVNEYVVVLDDARQKISVLEASLAKSKKDFAKLWQNFQAKVAQISSVEERRKELDEVFNSAKLKHSKLENILEERFEENKKLVQKLKEKEAEIQRLGDEVQTLDAYKEQVKVYESDFRMEREAREKQQGDILVLREEIHRLKLENTRLREDVESVHKHNLHELQRRYGPLTQVPQGYHNINPHAGIYGRGAQAPDNRMDHSRIYDSGRGSFEMPPQESDQVMQRACPKCRMTFPDLDTLQIHVLECID
ncbi:optineurin-like isoform X2 [Rhopilema esculentum]